MLWTRAKKLREMYELRFSQCVRRVGEEEIMQAIETPLCWGKDWIDPDLFPEKRCADCRFEGVCREIAEERRWKVEETWE